MQVPTFWEDPGRQRVGLPSLPNLHHQGSDRHAAWDAPGFPASAAGRMEARHAGLPQAQKDSPPFPECPSRIRDIRAVRVCHRSSGTDPGRRPLHKFGDMLGAPERCLGWERGAERRSLNTEFWVGGCLAEWQWRAGIEGGALLGPTS